MRFKNIRYYPRYISRRIRAGIIRCFLSILLPIFTVEAKLRPIPPDNRKKILVIVLGGLGDSLLFDTLFRRLKEKWPDSRIDILTGCFDSMWERIETIDRLIYFRFSRFKAWLEYPIFFRTIYRNRYDIVAEGLAMVPPKGIFPILTSLVFKASQAPIRIGRESTGILPSPRFVKTGAGRFSTGRDCSKKQNKYLTHILSILPAHKRSYHESSKIFEPLGLNYYRKKDEPRLGDHPDEDKWAENLIRKQWATRENLVVGFTIEVTWKIKEWSAEHFYEVVERGISYGMKFIMLGLERNKPGSLFTKFTNDHMLDLTGRTSLGEMISIIGKCDLFLSCDTGPAHIAQACRVPTIVLFGPSNEAEFGPFDREMHSMILPDGDYPCRPCVLGPCIKGKSCVHEITPDKVYRALIEKAAGLNRGKSNHGYVISKLKKRM